MLKIEIKNERKNDDIVLMYPNVSPFLSTASKNNFFFSNP